MLIVFDLFGRPFSVTLYYVTVLTVNKKVQDDNSSSCYRIVVYNLCLGNLQTIIYNYITDDESGHTKISAMVYIYVCVYTNNQ